MTRWRDGLWTHNPALVQLLGLCPLLAISTSAIAALGLGLATIATLALSAVVVSACRGWIPDEIRLPAFIAIIACAVTAADLLMEAFLYDLHGKLGLFVPLIVTNCVVLARLEAFARRAPVGAALADALAMGAGFAAALLVLGALREVIGTGCLLDRAGLLLPIPDDWLRVCIGDGRGLLIAVLPPGAFLGLAGLIALGNLVFPRPSGGSV